MSLDDTVQHHSLDQHPADESLLLAITTALERISIHDEAKRKIAECQAARAALASVRAHPEFSEGAMQAIVMTKKLAELEETKPLLVEQDAVETVSEKGRTVGGNERTRERANEGTSERANERTRD